MSKIIKSKKPRKYSEVSLVKLKPNSSSVKRIFNRKLTKGLSSKSIILSISKEIGVDFKYDGSIGKYIIYKGLAKEKPYYFILTIS